MTASLKGLVTPKKSGWNHHHTNLTLPSRRPFPRPSHLFHCFLSHIVSSSESPSARKRIRSIGVLHSDVSRVSHPLLARRGRGHCEAVRVDVFALLEHTRDDETDVHWTVLSSEKVVLRLQPIIIPLLIDVPHPKINLSSMVRFIHSSRENRNATTTPNKVEHSHRQSQPLLS